MAKTWLSIGTAAALAFLGVAIFVGRWHEIGAVGDLAPEASTWKVTLVASGDLAAQETALGLLPPLDFRRQHIFDERFQAKGVIPPHGRKETERREIVWRRASVGGTPQPFRLSYSFHCRLGVRPTPAMRQLTRVIDADPAIADCLRPTARIEADHQEVFDKAQALTDAGQTDKDQVHDIFHYVGRLENEPSLGTQSALQCLRDGGGDSGGKSRLFVALCRNRGIPARVVTGLILREQEQGVHYWAEAWVGKEWLPACLTHRHFGAHQLPKSYLVLQVGDEDLVHGKGLSVRFGFLVQAARDALPVEEGTSAAAARRLWRAVSFTSLRPAEQHLVKFLLLLPLASLIVSVYRTVIGVPTFGMFGPALLGLAFLNLQALPWGLSIFTLTVLAGWAMRRFIDRFHLLLVPRTSIVLSLIVVFLIAVVMVASQFGVAVTQFLSLLPLVILTHLVERFWTVEAEDGTATAFKTLFWTFVVAVTISIALSPEVVSAWMFHHPETLALVLAALLLLGRYTGYRLTELHRFRDFLALKPTSGEAP